MSNDEQDLELKRDFHEIVRVDWLYAGRWDRIHAPTSYTFSGDWSAFDVTFACGWHVDEASIPGIFSRMGLPRCSRCCDRLGFPRGIGSPKNDDTCRQLLGLTTASQPS